MQLWNNIHNSEYIRKICSFPLACWNIVEKSCKLQSGFSQYCEYKNDVKMELKPHTHTHTYTNAFEMVWACNPSKVKDN